MIVEAIQRIGSSPIWTALAWTMPFVLVLGLVMGLVLRWRLAARPEAGPERRHRILLTGLALLALSPIVVCGLLVTEFEGLTAPGIARSSALESDAGQDGTAPSHRDSDPLAFTNSASDHDSWSASSPWTAALPLLWLLGSFVVASRLVLGCRGLRRLRRGLNMIPESHPARRSLDTLARSWFIGRDLAIAVSRRAVTPFVLGIFRPIIVIPQGRWASLSSSQLEMILMHELAHVRRHDNLVIIAQRLAEIVLFFHPVVWRISRAISRERELCCDEIVVQNTGARDRYARLLASFVEAEGARVAVSAAMADRAIVDRIRRILQQEDPKMVRNGRLAALSAVLCLLLAIGLGGGLVGASTPRQDQDAAKKAKDTQVTETLLPSLAIGSDLLPVLVGAKGPCGCPGQSRTPNPQGAKCTDCHSPAQHLPYHSIDKKPDPHRPVAKCSNCHQVSGHSSDLEVYRLPRDENLDPRAERSDARILRVEESGMRVVFHAGRFRSIKIGQAFDVIRGGGYVGALRVDELMQDQARASVLFRVPNLRMQAGDTVTARLQKKADRSLKLPSEKKSLPRTLPKNPSIKRRLTSVYGKVTKVESKGDHLICDLGRRDGIRVGRRMDIVRGRDYLGRFRVVSVSEKSCRGIIELRATKLGSIASGDVVTEL